MANMATWWEGLLSLRPPQNETSSLLRLAFSSCKTVFLAVQSRTLLLMLELVLLFLPLPFNGRRGPAQFGRLT